MKKPRNGYLWLVTYKYSAQVGCVPPQLSETGDAGIDRSTKTHIDCRFRATGRDQTQACSTARVGRDQAYVDASTLMSPCVERQLVAAGRRSRTCATLSNWTPTRLRLVAVRRRNAHVASDPATDQLPFDARALMSQPVGRSQPVAAG